MDARFGPDLILAADFTATGDAGRRLGQELRLLAGQGLTVGLLQARPPEVGAIIAPEVQSCLRRGLAQRLSLAAARAAGAPRLVLHAPSLTDPSRLGLPWAGLRHVAVVCHSAADALCLPDAGPHVTLRLHPLHDGLRKTAKPAKPFAATWLPVAEALPVRQRRAAKVTIGWVGGLPDAAGQDTRLDHVCLDAAPYSLDRIVAAIDVLVVREPADTLVATMLASGRRVVATPDLRDRYGAGLLYRNDPVSGLRTVVAKGASRGPAPDLIAYVAACRSGPLTQYGHAVRPPTASAPRPILCLSSNGVGIGHLTRLLAIARRIGPEAEVVFATQAQAVGVVESFGYRVEYIPSFGAVGGDFATWDAWFAAHLARIIDRYDPSLVVYDGNHPSDGLMQAVASRRDCRLAWVRRGMWGMTTSEFLSNARWCDLVIEPGELAAERDVGVTAGLRGDALVVDPVCLLDPPDLFLREVAAARLGLNPARPAVLIQLGSGYQRDLLSMLDQIVGLLADVPGLQICVAEWVNGSVPLTLWPEVTVLRGFPISQYSRAFDFCISAAGYNSFHEAIAFGVPTLFVANRHPSMDDQYARARFAQDNAAAFEISETDLHDLPEIVRLLLHDVARAYLADRCRALTRPNGAVAAAAALLDLSGAACSLALAAE